MYSLARLGRCRATVVTLNAVMSNLRTYRDCDVSVFTAITLVQSTI